jgi:hypothetical protein
MVAAQNAASATLSVQAEATRSSIAQLQSQLLGQLRAELMARINALPIELARDRDAYNLLREQLTRDLEMVFVRLPSPN